MTIIRSQERPATLMCGKFHNVNLETFYLALSTAFTYFSVLLNVLE